MFELTGKERSPLEALSVLRFGGRTYLQTAVITTISGPSILLRNNPNRVFWLMNNFGLYDETLSFEGNGIQIQGVTLQAKGGNISMSYKEDGEAVGYAVYGQPSIANTSIYILEVIRE